MSAVLEKAVKLNHSLTHLTLFSIASDLQAIHLNSVYALGVKAGWYDPNVTRVEHVDFGVVLGEDR